MFKKMLGFVIALMLMVPVVASAHAELVSSNPKDGSVVKGPISSVNITFGEAVKHFNSMTIKDEKGNTYAVKKYDINGEKVKVDLSKSLTNGQYTFEWQVLSEDGHVAPGELQFSVGDKAQNKVDKQTTSTQTQPAKHASQQTPLVLILIVIVVLIIVVGFYFVIRKKK